MIKLILLSKRKPGTTMEEFREYYETSHVPLAWRCMPKLVRYTRNYLTQPLGWEPEFDCIVELWVDLDPPWTEARLKLTDAQGQAALTEDEANFMDRSKTHVSVVEEAGGARADAGGALA